MAEKKACDATGSTDEVRFVRFMVFAAGEAAREASGWFSKGHREKLPDLLRGIGFTVDGVGGPIKAAETPKEPKDEPAETPKQPKAEPEKPETKVPEAKAPEAKKPKAKDSAKRPSA